MLVLALIFCYQRRTRHHEPHTTYHKKYHYGSTEIMRYYIVLVSSTTIGLKVRPLVGDLTPVVGAIDVICIVIGSIMEGNSMDVAKSRWA